MLLDMGILIRSCTPFSTFSKLGTSYYEIRLTNFISGDFTREYVRESEEREREKEQIIR